MFPILCVCRKLFKLKNRKRCQIYQFYLFKIYEHGISFFLLLLFLLLFSLTQSNLKKILIKCFIIFVKFNITNFITNERFNIEQKLNNILSVIASKFLLFPLFLMLCISVIHSQSDFTHQVSGIFHSI